MSAGTGELQALTAQVAALAEQMRNLSLWDYVADSFYAAGYRAGELETRAAMLGRTTETSRAPKPRGARPSHLRSVGGGAR